MPARAIDRRSVRISLTEKGKEVHRIVGGLYEKHARTVEQIGGIPGEDLARVNISLPAARTLLDRPDQVSALILTR